MVSVVRLAKRNSAEQVTDEENRHLDRVLARHCLRRANLSLRWSSLASET